MTIGLITNKTIRGFLCVLGRCNFSILTFETPLVRARCFCRRDFLGFDGRYLSVSLMREAVHGDREVDNNG